MKHFVAIDLSTAVPMKEHKAVLDRLMQAEVNLQNCRAHGDNLRNTLRAQERHYRALVDYLQNTPLTFSEN